MDPLLQLPSTFSTHMTADTDPQRNPQAILPSSLA